MFKVFGSGSQPANAPLNSNAGTPEQLVTPYSTRPPDSAPQPRRQQSADARQTVEEIRKEWRRAADARRLMEREWVLSIAMVEGRQWLAWDDAANKIISLIDESDPDRYITENLLRPLMTKWIALLTMTKPDASVAPDTTSPIDRAAAAEGRAILGNLARRLNQQQQNIEIAYWLYTTGVCYQYSWWDANAMADIPKIGSDGSLQGKQRARVGDHCVEVKSPFEIFLDPAARRFKDCRYVVDMTVRPLVWFEEQFGKAGQFVQAESAIPYLGYLGYLQGYGGISQLPGYGANFSALIAGKDVAQAPCINYYEPPGPKYQNGRWIVIGGDRLLYDGEWLPEWLEDSPRRPFPMFTRYTLEECAGHPYSRGLVPDLAPLQVEYNRLASRVIERIEEDKLTVIIDKGAGVRVDAYVDDIEEGRHVRKILYNPGSTPPTMEGAPPVTADVWRLKQELWANMQHMAGIHDPNLGQTEGGVTAGIAIEMLQQSDRTQLAIALNAMESGLEDTANIAILSYRFNAQPYLQRLVGLDDTGNPDQARNNVQAFTALSQGGAASCIVTAGSATPKTPAGRNQEILTYLQMGLFGPVGSPDAAAIAVQLMSLSRSDLVLDMLQQQIAQRQQMAQQAAQQQSQQLAQQAQHQQDLENLRNQGKLQTEVVRQAGSMQREQAAVGGKILLAEQQHGQIGAQAAQGHAQAQDQESLRLMGQMLLAELGHRSQMEMQQQKLQSQPSQSYDNVNQD